MSLNKSVLTFFSLLNILQMYKKVPIVPKVPIAGTIGTFFVGVSLMKIFLQNVVLTFQSEPYIRKCARSPFQIF